uniref:Uncharacterized protein n=1 Tax=Anas platyrhynchos platyrhynchos TaxID=8840 RepID=A0A493T3S4_ANAPP
MNYILRVNYCFIIQIKVLFVSLFLIILMIYYRKHIQHPKCAPSTIYSAMVKQDL